MTRLDDEKSNIHTVLYAFLTMIKLTYVCMYIYMLIYCAVYRVGTITIHCTENETKILMVCFSRDTKANHRAIIPM